MTRDAKFAAQLIHRSAAELTPIVRADNPRRAILQHMLA
jgi:hypothetical protein